MTTLGAAALAIEAVTKVYRMGEVEVHALRGVDLALAAGELVTLIGPSGSGKSTLLDILGGLDVPTTGHVRYRDEDLTVGDDKALAAYRREHVGFVFQFFNLVPTLTARENATGVVVLSAIARVNRELGTRTAIITHNAVVADTSDRVLHTADGRIVQDRHNPHRAAPEELRW